MPTDVTFVREAPEVVVSSDDKSIPAYLRDVYSWAYLSPVGRAIFDRPVVVSAILWGNYHRLIATVVKEIAAGSKVLQVACVYGAFSVRLAEAVGPAGALDVIDIAPIQVKHTRKKLAAHPNARVNIADATSPPAGPYDVACSFFLLHEVPEDYKTRIVTALLDRVPVGGKVVFVDYHEPAKIHPLRPVMDVVFAWLEPFAKVLWSREIASYAPNAHDFQWTKETYFGGMYQKVVAVRTAP
jgi:hypothetical protein